MTIDLSTSALLVLWASSMYAAYERGRTVEAANLSRRFMTPNKWARDNGFLRACNLLNVFVADGLKGRELCDRLRSHLDRLDVKSGGDDD